MAGWNQAANSFCRVVGFLTLCIQCHAFLVNVPSSHVPNTIRSSRLSCRGKRLRDFGLRGLQSHNHQYESDIHTRISSSAKAPVRGFPGGSISSLLAPILAAGLLLFSPAEFVYASTLPASPVLDEARSLGNSQREKLAAELTTFEEQTGWKVRVLTRDNRRLEQRTSSQEIRDIWKLPDDKAVVVILDASNSNVLNFNSGAAVSKLLPSSFFSEMTGRLGNVYEVRKSGEAGVVTQSVGIIEACLQRAGGCRYVPGIGDDQYTATVIGSLGGGLVFGMSALTALQFIEKKATGSDAIFKFAPALFLPLWGTFFFGLGLNPLLQRQVETVYILQNTGVFLATALATVAIWPVLMRFDPPSIRW